MQRFQLYYILSSDKQHACISKNVPNDNTFFCAVVSRGGDRSSWNVRFDVLPCDENSVVNISRGKLAVIQPGEEELPLNARDQARFDELGVRSLKKLSLAQKSTNNH